MRGMTPTYDQGMNPRGSGSGSSRKATPYSLFFVSSQADVMLPYGYSECVAEAYQAGGGGDNNPDGNGYSRGGKGGDYAYRKFRIKGGEKVSVTVAGQTLPVNRGGTYAGAHSSVTDQGSGRVLCTSADPTLLGGAGVLQADGLDGQSGGKGGKAGGISAGAVAGSADAITPPGGGGAAGPLGGGGGGGASHQTNSPSVLGGAGGASATAKAGGSGGASNTGTISNGGGGGGGSADLPGGAGLAGTINSGTPYGGPGGNGGDRAAGGGFGGTRGNNGNLSGNFAGGGGGGWPGGGGGCGNWGGYAYDVDAYGAAGLVKLTFR